MAMNPEELDSIRDEGTLNAAEAGKLELGGLEEGEILEDEPQSRPPGRKRRRGKKNKLRKAARNNEDEDGDFGGMFDEDCPLDSFLVEGDGGQQPPSDYGVDDDDDDYEDDDIGPMQKVAFVVEGEPNFELAEPDDGWEFIRRVKWEAAAYPDIHVAKQGPGRAAEQTPYIPIIPPIPACDPEVLPSKEWEETAMQAFSELREKLEFQPDGSSGLPHIRDEAAWRNFCFGGPASNTTDDGPDLDDVGSLLHLQPFFTTVTRLDEVSRASLLQNHVAWLDEVNTLPRYRAMWLLALTAALDKPIDAETSFALRSLLRTCAGFRATKAYQDEYELQMLNRIIVIAGKYFGQDDSKCP